MNHESQEQIIIETATPSHPRICSLRFKASCTSGRAERRTVHTAMDEWTEIRRKVLVGRPSKRSIHRDCGIGRQALAKILANPELPAIR